MSTFKCFLGQHKYEIYEEITLTTKTDVAVGKVIISRCKDCGKINKDYIDLCRLW